MSTSEPDGLPEPGVPADLTPVNPYAPPEADTGDGTAGNFVVGAASVLGQVVWALLRVAAVLASSLIAFFATCIATLGVSNDALPVYFISPVVGVAVLVLAAKFLFFGKPRSPRQ